MIDIHAKEIQNDFPKDGTHFMVYRESVSFPVYFNLALGVFVNAHTEEVCDPYFRLVSWRIIPYEELMYMVELHKSLPKKKESLSVSYKVIGISAFIIVVVIPSLYLLLTK